MAQSPHDLYRQGKWSEALAAAHQQLHHQPNHVALLNLMAVCSLHLGDHPQAQIHWQRALQIKPDHVDTLINLAKFYSQIGRLGEAGEACHQILRQQPNHGEAHRLLAELLRRQGRLQEAEAEFRTAIALHPGMVTLLIDLGNVLHAQQRSEEAVIAYQTALQQQPDNAAALGNLANVLQLMNRHDEAEASYQAALRLTPGDVGILGNYGQLLQKMERHAEAAEIYREQLSQQPNHGDGWNSLGYALEKQAKFKEATHAYQKAVKLQPNHELFLNNYGLSLFKTGLVAEALAVLGQAVQEHPHSLLLIRSFSLTLLYDPNLTPTTRHALRCQAVAGLPPPPPAVGRRCRSSAPPRRIAMVSSDFRNHPVARNVLPLLEHLNHQHFEIYCYAERLGCDDYTNRFQALAQQWRWTNDWSDQQVAQQMVADEIDVCIYLAGHFDLNRLEVCRYRPAPLQISYYDAASSGFPEMDYFFTDTTLHPAGCQEPFSEKLYNLPVLYQYGHLRNAPDPGEPPVLSQEGITFGSFNNPKKINDHVLNLWSDLLHALPHSRLCLKYKNHYGDPSLQRHTRDHFLRRGIAAERILLDQGSENLHQHLLRYQTVDIALDTFPFTGATTTYEALWMGVPVITLAGDSFVSRMAASLLLHCNLGQWVASSHGDYITVARKLAEDPLALRQWRQTLRQTFAQSSLCQAPAYARAVEEGILTLWRR